MRALAVNLYQEWRRSLNCLGIDNFAGKDSCKLTVDKQSQVSGQWLRHLFDSLKFAMIFDGIPQAVSLQIRVASAVDVSYRQAQIGSRTTLIKTNEDNPNPRCSGPSSVVSEVSHIELRLP